ncbi:MAG: cell division protein FtsA [Candidatus Krumholzibacteria bacterium]|nr:cell division protein FtsA [Candidatus Krumholzibacteria bacterium]
MLPEFIVSVDIGTERTAVLVGETGAGGPMRIIGAAEQPSAGVRKGMIVDIEQAADTLRRTARHAARMAGVEIHGLCTGLTGPHIRSFDSRGMVPLSGGRREVTAADVECVTRTARTITIPGDVEILHAIPQDFTVDDTRGVRDPAGMTAERLGTEIHLITAQTVHVENIVKVVERAGYEVVNIVFTPLAAANAVLSEAEREAGSLLIDLGAGVSSFVLYQSGSVRASGVLAAGAANVTNDLAVGLRLPRPVAEELKLRRGLALSSLAGDGEVLTVPESGSEGGEIRREILAAIIEPRCEEIFSMIKSAVWGDPRVQPAGSSAVLTGGGSKLEGIGEVASQVFGMPARVGRPADLDGLCEIVAGESWSACVGMLLYESDRLAREQQQRRGRRGLGRMIGSLKRITGLY